MKYKVIIEKTLYVEADSTDDAEDEVFFGQTYNEEERIKKVIPMGGSEQ